MLILFAFYHAQGFPNSTGQEQVFHPGMLFVSISFTTYYAAEDVAFLKGGIM